MDNFVSRIPMREIPHTRVTLFQFVSVFGNCYSERLVGHTSVEMKKG